MNMRKKTASILIISLIAVIGLFTISSNINYSDHSIPINLSTEEQVWLTEHQDKELTYSLLSEQTSLKHLEAFVDELSDEFNIQFTRVPYVSPASDSSSEKMADLIIGSVDALPEDMYAVSSFTFEPEYVCYIRSDDTLSSIKDLDDRQIGMLDNDPFTQYLYELSPDTKKHTVHYQSVDALSEALHIGQIDVMITEYRGDEILDSSRQNALKMVYPFKEINQTIGFISSNSNASLISLIDKKLTEMDYHGEIERLLKDSIYYTRRELFENGLSEEQLQWIADHDSISVWLNPNNTPFSYYSEGEYSGIAVSALEHFSNISGLKIKYIDLPEAEVLPKLEDSTIDLAYGLTSYEDQENSVRTAAFMRSNNIIVINMVNESVLAPYNLNSTKIGIPTDPSLEGDVRKIIPHSEIVHFDSYATLLENVQTKNVEYAILPDIAFYYNLPKLKNHTTLMEARIFNQNSVQSFWVAPDEPMLKILMDRSFKYITHTRLISNGLSSLPDQRSDTKAMQIVTAISLLLVFVLIAVVTKSRFEHIEKDRLNTLFKKDHLTKLPNKFGLEALFDEMSAKFSHIALITLDIDDFKKVNDRYGHKAGDDILLQLSEKLQELYSKPIVVSRTYGDEFSVLFPIIDLRSATEFADTLFNQVKLFLADNAVVPLSNLSMGMALYPEQASSFDELYKFTNHALFHRKHEDGKNGYTIFSKDIYQMALDDESLATDFSMAFKRGEIALYYQPQVLSTTRTVIGAEVLTRWNHPKRGMIFPDKFIPLAEKNNLLRAFDFYVLRQACKQLKAWESEPFYPLSLSVNMSTSTISDPDIVRILKEIIEDEAIDPKYLTIEMTEELGLTNFNLTSDILHQISQLGIKIALDDFGKGYSSLIYLEKIPINVLKIDKEFITDIDTNENARKVYKTISELAEQLNLKVVSEGIESEQQMSTLRNIAESVMQGYLFSKPMELLTFKKYLKQQTVKKQFELNKKSIIPHKTDQSV